MSIETPRIEVIGGLATETTSFSRRLSKLDSYPSLAEQLTKLRDQLRDERPKDHDVRLSAFNMHTDGTVGANARTPITRKALGDVLGFIDAPRGALGVLESLRPEARAVAFNDLKRSFLSNNEDRFVRFRTIQLPGYEARAVRAVTSDKHSGESGDDAIVADVLKQMMPDAGTVKARIVRTFDRTDMELFFPKLKSEVKMGDVSYAKLWVQNSEVRSAGFEANFGLFRLVCLNGMTRMVEGVSTTVRHVGNIQFKVHAAIETAFAGAEEFFFQWERAQGQALNGGRGDVLERLSKRMKQLPSGLWAEAATLWDADGEQSAGDTVAGLVNALTRASQAYDYATAAGIEKAAGSIVEGTVVP